MYDMNLFLAVQIFTKVVLKSNDSADLQRLIDSAPYWHHKIELAPGVFSPGLQDTQSLLDQISLPTNLSGMRVLDIGARDGFFSFEAERRGAVEVVALDNVPPHKPDLT